MSGQKDVLARLKTALARSQGQILPTYWTDKTPLRRRNAAKRALLADAIAEIERLRAIVAEDERIDTDRAAADFITNLRPTPTPFCEMIGVAWAEVPP